MTDPFSSMYQADDLKRALGAKYIGPNKLPHGEEVRIAIFKSEEDSDGHDVEMHCTAMPAQFFTIKALDTKNSCGELKEGFILSTGSGELEWAMTTARKIAEGMIGVAT